MDFEDVLIEPRSAAAPDMRAERSAGRPRPSEKKIAIVEEELLR